MKRLVRNLHGEPLLCCWDDCGQYGDDRVKIVVREGKKKVHYIFCSTRHRDYWAYSHIAYGYAPPGARKIDLIVRGV